MTDIDNITPRNDAAFKIIFADPKHERILVHFLNCAIESKDPIRKVRILNNELPKQHVLQKGSRLDILAETETGTLIDVEMQVGQDPHMVGRTLFYWSEMFVGSLEVGETYGKLRRTISISILNFKLFGQDARYWRKCHLTDDLTHEKITDLLEMQFVEIDKLRKPDKESPLSFWIEFFKNPYSEVCKELYKLVPELKEAKDVFEAAKADPVKRKMMQAREDAIRNYANDLANAKEEGVAEGRAEGLAEGLAEGRAEGAAEERAKAEIEKAELQAKADEEKAELQAKADEEKAELQAKADEEKKASAKKMLAKGMSTSDVSDILGLSIEEVEKLK